MIKLIESFSVKLQEKYPYSDENKLIESFSAGIRKRRIPPGNNRLFDSFSAGLTDDFDLKHSRIIRVK